MDSIFGHHSSIELQGNCTNISANLSAGVKMTLTRKIVEKEGVNHEILQLKGIFDNTNLFGKFDIEGREITRQNENVIGTQFVGSLLLGNDGSGYSKNTKATFVITLSFSSCGAYGTYHIGKLPSYDFDQYGTLNLHFYSPKRSSRKKTQASE